MNSLLDQENQKGVNYLILIFVEVPFKNGPSRDTGDIGHKIRNEDITTNTTQQMNSRAHKLATNNVHLYFISY